MNFLGSSDALISPSINIKFTNRDRIFYYKFNFEI
jgi:hypothetical protein